MTNQSSYPTPKLIAEIGCNHMGQLDIAKELIDIAYSKGVHYVKFQKRNSKELLSEEQYNAPHPEPYNSYGETYGKHREFLEFTKSQHEELQAHCKQLGATYITSVWDVSSAKEIITLDPKIIKVPSACNNNTELLKVLRDEYSNNIHISLGMTTRKEEDGIVNFFAKTNQAHRLVIYMCTTGYPIDFDDVCLLEILRIKEAYGQSVQAIGFSGHHNGIGIDTAAYVLGAEWIERHFTKNRTWKGTDHAASLEPRGLELLQRNLEVTRKSLTYKEKEILEVEIPQREKLKFRPQA